MKKFIVLLVTLSSVVLVATSVASDRCLVETTFEEDSAGPGTWDISAGYGWDESDPASKVDWYQGGSDGQVRFITGGACQGDQCGRIKGGSTKHARLSFASGENTGVYVMTWYQKYEDVNATVAVPIAGVKITDNYNAEILQVLMKGDANGTTVIEVKDDNGTGNDSHTATLLNSYSDNIWYEFEMELDFTNKTYEAKVKQAGAANWASTVAGCLRNSSSIESFDKIACTVNDPNIYGYWDDIKVKRAAPYIVNTTFELDNPVSGMWTSGQWGDKEANTPPSGTGNNDPDPASGVYWINEYGGDKCSIARDALLSYAGAQFGSVTGSTSGKSCGLDFASGENTGIYVMTWAQKYTNHSATTDRYAAIAIFDDDNADWSDRALGINMKGDASGTTIITVDDCADGNDAHITTLLASYLVETWYEFKMELDLSNKTYEIKVKQAGIGSWEATASGLLRFAGSIDSFDRILCRATHSEVRGSWDNIKVKSVPYIVKTTFEAGSGGVGTWPGDAVDGQLWCDGNDPDPVSGVQWQFKQGDANGIVVTTAIAKNGTQSGKIWRTAASESGTASSLHFGDGDNVGPVVLKWFQKYQYVSGGWDNYAGIILGSFSVGDPCDPNNLPTSWNNKCAAVLMKADADGATTIGFCYGTQTGAAIDAILLDGYEDGEWYEFEVELNFYTNEIRASVKQVGEPGWEGTISGYLQNGADANSFDWIQCKTNKTSGFGYWDDIVVLEEQEVCGSYGYSVGDMNRDCYVDFKDFTMIASEWLDCSEPNDPNCQAY